MNRILYLFLAAVLPATGCRSLEVAEHPRGLPLRYHNAQYDFTFFLPAGWQGYSVMIEDWKANLTDPPAQERGPTLVFRHPQWTPAEPRQDIPILIFTRRQWEADKAGTLPIFAGGVDFEIGHNDKYVFGAHSRFNWSELNGWQEASAIVEKNRAASAPHLYPE